MTWALVVSAWAALAAAEPFVPPAAPSERVTDRAGLLGATKRQELERRLAANEARTGRQVVVWIDEGTGGVPIEEWAARSFEAWRVGRRGLDDGIALFVFVRDRTARIEVGYGLEDVVTDARASRVVHEVLVPRLAAGDGEGAIQTTVDAILVLVSDASSAEPAKGPSELPLGRLVLYGIAALAFLILAITHPRLALQLLVVLASGHRRHGGGGIGGSGWSGGGGRSGGGGASGSW